MEKVVDIPVAGPAATKMPQLDHEFAGTGLRVMALPPGRTEVRLLTEAHFIDINLLKGSHDIAVGSDKMVTKTIPADSICWAPPGTDFRLQADNTVWGLLIELDPKRGERIEMELLDGQHLPVDYFDYRRTNRSALLAQMLIDQFRRGDSDPLFLEGVTLGIVGDALCAVESGARLRSLSGYDTRLAWAIDYIETHYADPLSVGELAAVAAMSAGHFARCFKAATGEPVWSFVRRRRCERAKEMVQFTDLPLAEIAFRCGFATQGHLTTCMKEQFSITPGRLRAS